MVKSQLRSVRKSIFNFCAFTYGHQNMIEQNARYMQVRTKSDLKGLILGLYASEGSKAPQLTAGGVKFDDSMHGQVTELIQESGLSGTLGKGKLFSNVGDEYKAIAVIGLGKEGAGYNSEEVLDEGMENVRVCAAVGARALQLLGCTLLCVDGMEYPEQAAEGASLAVWRFDINKRKNNRAQVPKLTLNGSDDQESWTRGLFKAEAQNLARRLTDTPANQMSPSIFAQAAVDALCPCGVTVEVRSMEWIEEVGLGSLLTIAKGSCEPPLFLEMNYCGASPEYQPVLMLGNGLTFNSGGLCLKQRRKMDQQRGAMAGAAVVVAAMRAAAALTLPINVTALVPLCEHMPSGMTVKPGDVISLLNGCTLGIRNTNNAGVVMMADPILYGQATYKPTMLLDIAVLGEAVRKGLGASATGLWTNTTFLWKQFKRAGAVTGDRMWRMPLWRHFSSLIKPGRTYDMCNEGKGPADSCLAAALLKEFVPCVDWVHLDLRSSGMVAREGVSPYLLKNCMTGRPTRTIIQFLYQLACAKDTLNS